MKILAFERELPGATTAQFQAYAKEEARQAWELYQAGVVRELYFRGDQTTAVLVLECPTLEDAEAALASMPFVQQGLIAFDLVPLRPYPGFERLFDQEGHA